MLESARVDYRPTMINLTHIINIVVKELIGTINAVSRVREALGDNAPIAKKPAVAAATTTASITTDNVAATTTAAADPTGETVGGNGGGGATNTAGEGAGGEAKAPGEGLALVSMPQVSEKRFREEFSSFCFFRV